MLSLLSESMTSGGSGWPFSMAERSVACISLRSLLFSQAGTTTIATIMMNGARGMRTSNPSMGFAPFQKSWAKRDAAAF
ncbi:hypothetical protein D3C72_943670 [compost metagenome]